MKIEIFKIGKHTSSDGRIIEYKTEDLQSIALIYNEKIKLSNSFKAPLVLGHPKDDEPALGWVDSLEVIGDKLLANVENIPTATKALIDKGYFRKVSISLYSDKMLKHIGLLGAATPAVKGLENLHTGNTETTETTETTGNTDNTNENYRERKEYILFDNLDNDLDNNLDNHLDNHLEFSELINQNKSTNNEAKLLTEYNSKLEGKIQDLELKLYKYQIKEKLFKDTNNYNNEFSENILDPLFELQMGSPNNKTDNIENILSNIYNFIENNQKKNRSEFNNHNADDFEFGDAFFENPLQNELTNNGLTKRLIDDIQNVNKSNNYTEFENKENINPEKLELHKFINEIATKNNISYTDAIDLIN